MPTQVTSIKQQEKAAKRLHLKKIRRGIEDAQALADRSETPIRRLIARHDQIRLGIIGLWNMGFWSEHIVECVGAPLTEELVLGVLRRHYRQMQDELASFKSTKHSENNHE
jgi:hypothetical protein